jgi:hypothetical protein
MQQVLNSRERNEAFLKFLLFFLVTVTLVVIAVFFDYRLPDKEMDMLRSEVAVSRSGASYQQQFVTRVEDAYQYIDSARKPGVNANQVNRMVDNKLSDLNTLQLKDSSSYARLNNITLQALNELHETRKNLVIEKDKVARLTADLNDFRQKQADANSIQAPVRGF